MVSIKVVINFSWHTIFNGEEFSATLNLAHSLGLVAGVSVDNLHDYEIISIITRISSQLTLICKIIRMKNEFEAFHLDNNRQGRFDNLESSWKRR